MVRFLIIRHGETHSNVREWTYEVAVRRGHMTQEEADKVKDRLRLEQDVNYETCLTPNGKEQARLLGEFYAPLLARAARGESGQLHVFNSPMFRNLQTLDPLMQKFLSMGININSEVRCDLMEIGGVCHPLDRATLRKAQGMLDAGQMEQAERLIQEHSWKPVGFAPREIGNMFPWARIQPGTFPSGKDVPWFAGGQETRRQVQMRMHRLAEWLEGLKDDLSSKDIVLMIGHGDQMSRMLNTVLVRAMIGKDQALQLKEDDPKFMFPFFPVANTAVQILRWEKGGAPLLEAFQRLDHLGPETAPDTLMRSFRFMGWLQPNKNDPVGHFGLKAPDAAQYFVRKDDDKKAANRVSGLVDEKTSRL